MIYDVPSRGRWTARCRPAGSLQASEREFIHGFVNAGPVVVLKIFARWKRGIFRVLFHTFCFWNGRYQFCSATSRPSSESRSGSLRKSVSRSAPTRPSETFCYGIAQLIGLSKNLVSFAKVEHLRLQLRSQNRNFVPRVPKVLPTNSSISRSRFNYKFNEKLLTLITQHCIGWCERSRGKGTITL